MTDKKILCIIVLQFQSRSGRYDCAKNKISEIHIQTVVYFTQYFSADDTFRKSLYFSDGIFCLSGGILLQIRYVSFHARTYFYEYRSFARRGYYMRPRAKRSRRKRRMTDLL